MDELDETVSDWRDEGFTIFVLQRLETTLHAHPLTAMTLMGGAPLPNAYQGHLYNLDDVLFALQRARATLPAPSAAPSEWHYDVELHAARSAEGALRRGHVYAHDLTSGMWGSQWRVSDTYVMPNSFSTLLRVHRLPDAAGVTDWDNWDAGREPRDPDRPSVGVRSQDTAQSGPIPIRVPEEEQPR